MIADRVNAASHRVEPTFVIHTQQKGIVMVFDILHPFSVKLVKYFPCLGNGKF